MSNVKDSVVQQNKAVTVRISAVANVFEDFSKRIGVAHWRGSAAQKRELESLLTAAEEDGKRLHGQLLRLTGAEDMHARLRSQISQSDQTRIVVAAIEALARAKSAVLAPVDTLFALTLVHSTPEDRRFIAGLGEVKFGGWARLPEIIELTKELGVLTWWNERDRRHRVVNVNWLSAHEDIRRFVLGEVLRGRRCRFCRIEETPDCDNLIAVSPDERRARTSDAAGRAIDLHALQGCVHTQCLLHWNQWISLAKQYATDEAAEAADLAAGRTSVEVPPAPRFEPDPAPPVGVYVRPGNADIDTSGQEPRAQPPGLNRSTNLSRRRR